MIGKPKGRSSGAGQYQGEGWSVRGPKLKLRHVAALQSGRWMGRRANTRVPAALMVAGYPATLVIALCSPFVVVGVGLLASLVIWHVSYRSVVRPNEHATEAKLSAAADWATRVTALTPAYLVWFLLVHSQISSADGFLSMVAALFSIVFDGRWFLGYASACTLAWLLIFRAPHVVTKHHERKAAESSIFNGMDEFEGTRVVSRKPTRVGERYRLNITGSGKAVSDFLDKKIKERIAGRLGLPAARVLVEPVAKNAGMIDVSIRRTDPWATELVHPRAPGYEQGRIKVTEPIELGMEPEDGVKLVLELVTKEGAQHIVIIAGTRGGKTTLANSILERLTRPAPNQRDTDVAMIDITKGKDGRAWAPAVAESYMGPENTEPALACLERHVDLISARARVNRDAVWKVGTAPERRAKAIVLDEASALLAHPDQAIAQRARQAVSFIMGKGASELVFLIIMSQRGVLAHLGTSDVNANSFVKIMLGVSKRGEMQFVVPDWEVLGMPDMSKYGEGRKGVVLISPVAQAWSAGRTYNLSDLDLVRRIAADRVIKDEVHLAILRAEQEYAKVHPDPEHDDPEVKAAVEVTEEDLFEGDPGPEGDLMHEPPADGVSDSDEIDPSDPDQVPGAPWMTSTPRPPATTSGVPMPRKLTDRERRLMAGFGKPSTTTGGWKPRPPEPVRAVEEIKDTTEAAVSTTDHALAVELGRSEEESRKRWGTRELATAKADQAATVPESFAVVVLETASAHGPVTRQQVVNLTGLKKTIVAERLRIMVNQGVLTRTGQGAGTRYEVRIPEPSEAL
jgi:hypothetical protein